MRFTDEIRRRLAAEGDADTARAQEAYLKGQRRQHGWTGPRLDALEKELRPSLEALPLAERVEVAWELLDDPFGESQTLACTWLHRLRRHLGPQALERLAPIFDRRGGNWASCDAMCSKILRYRLPEEAGRVADWSRLDDPWRRRAACVAFVNEARKGLYAEQIHRVVPAALALDHRFSQLGAGWLLRERWLAAPAEVEAYVLKTPMRREALRYAIEKMPAETQRRILKETEYKAWLDRARQERDLEVLSVFVRGLLFHGVLTPEAEQEILRQARELRVPEEAARRRIEALLSGSGGQEPEPELLGFLGELPQAPAEQPVGPDPIAAAISEALYRRMPPSSIEAILGDAFASRLSPAETARRVRAASEEEPSLPDSVGLHELLDTLLGLVMQNLLGPSSVSALVKRGIDLGYPEEITAPMVAEFQSTLDACGAGIISPESIIGVPEGSAPDRVRESYKRLRSSALTQQDPASVALATARLDAAWVVWGKKRR